MKKYFLSFKALLLVGTLNLSALLTGCYQAAPEEELSAEGSKLCVMTRSVTGTLDYPVTVYAFDSSGKLKAEKTLESEADELSMELAVGTYRITAVAGAGGVKVPSSISGSAELSTNDDNYCTSALMMGQADVTISTESVSTDILMSPQVASVEISLAGLPSSTQTVAVSLSKQYSKISMEGELSSPLNTTINCTKSDEGWTTGKFYILPGGSTNTVLTISMSDGTSSASYGYTYNSPLKAGTPYILNGSYASALTLNGTIEASGWNSETVLDFNFGPGASNSSGGNTGGEGSGGGTSGGNTSTGDTITETVSSIPPVGSLWNGHAVALVEDSTSTEANITLISLNEWTKVASANSTKKPTEALELANAYSESGMSSWHIPARTEATALKAKYAGDNLSIINNVITAAEGTAITDVDESGTNVRYLCEDAKYSFTFKGGSTSITQGGTTTTYRLRLVKTVHVKVSK